jgi:hypothetical protein
MFAEMPLDNRTVYKFAALAAMPGFSLGFPAFLGRLKRHRAKHDLMFRRGWQFCNIEPKICQYG